MQPRKICDICQTRGHLFSVTIETCMLKISAPTIVHKEREREADAEDLLCESAIQTLQILYLSVVLLHRFHIRNVTYCFPYIRDTLHSW